MPSAKDFIQHLAQQPPAVPDGPTSDRPDLPPGSTNGPQPAPDHVQPATDGPVLPTVVGPATAQLVLRLATAGHHLLARDDRLFVTNASRLSSSDRAMLRQHKEVFLAYAHDWIVDDGMAGVSRPSVYDAERIPSSTSSPQSLAEFLGNDLPRLEVTNWTPDEPPSLDGINEIVLNFATTGLDWVKGARPVGVTVSTLDGQLCRFLPFAFQGGGNLDEPTIKRWVEREVRGKKIYGGNTRFDIHEARVWGVDLEEQGNTFSDIMHTAALLDDHRKRFALDKLAEDYLPGEPVVIRTAEQIHSVYDAGTVAEREHYTARLVGRLRTAMYPEIDKQELRAIQDLEDSVIPCVVEMEKNGQPLDMALNEQYHKECLATHDKLIWEIAQEVGFAFDHSAKSWQRLFEVLHLPPTDGNAEAIVGKIDHPIVKKAHLAAQYASLDSKTFKAYQEAVGSDGILHFDINQLRGEQGGTVTGRFSIGLVQQVPNKDNHSAIFGEELFPRRLFIPGSGDYLEADAAQIEFRLYSHYANNAKVLEGYKADPWMSFHKMMWEMLKTYKPDMSYVNVKSFNFAHQYGAKSIKLAVMMGFISEEEGNEIRSAKRWNDPRLDTIHEIEAAYKHAMPEGEKLLESAAQAAEVRGFVKTYFGRRSRYPKKFKAYTGLNKVLQGTGADILKLKMVELHRARKATGFVMRLTIHDAFGGDATTAETREKVSTILNHQSFPDLKVPILWTCATGSSWAACKG